MGTQVIASAMRPHENQNGRPGRILTVSIVVLQERERLLTIFRYSIELTNEIKHLIANLLIRKHDSFLLDFVDREQRFRRKLGPVNLRRYLEEYQRILGNSYVESVYPCTRCATVLQEFLAEPAFQMGFIFA